MQCGCSVECVESLRGVDEQYCISAIRFQYICMHSVYCSLASGLLSSSQLEWAAGLDNILRSNTHYTLSTNSPLNFPDSYWSNSTFAFIQWNQTVSYQGLYGHRINALWTQSPCYCGYCLTLPCRWLFKGLASEDSSETIRVNPRRASCSFCSQSRLPDHLTVYLRIHRFRILLINWTEEQWT